MSTLTNITTKAKELLDAVVPGGLFGAVGRGESIGSRIHACIAAVNTLQDTMTSEQANIDAAEAKLALQANRFVKATLTAAGGTGGATAGTLSGQLVDINTGANVTAVRTVKIVTNASADRYAGSEALVSTLTFGSATTGTKLVSGNGYLVIETDATGAFAIATANSADGTFYLSACTADGGVSATGRGCNVVESNSVSAVWSA